MALLGLLDREAFQTLLTGISVKMAIMFPLVKSIRMSFVSAEMSVIPSMVPTTTLEEIVTLVVTVAVTDVTAMKAASTEANLNCMATVGAYDLNELDFEVRV